MAATTDDIMNQLKIIYSSINDLKQNIIKSDKKTDSISAELQRLRLKITSGGK